MSEKSEEDSEAQPYIDRILKEAVEKGWIMTKKPRQGGREITFKDLRND